MEAGHAAKDEEQARSLMALGDEGGNRFLAGLSALSRAQQAAWLGGIALGIALIVAVVLWTRHADYAPLFGGMPDKDMADVVEILDKLGIGYQVDSSTGAVKVPSGQVHEIRLKLAGQGLPRESGGGYELMEQERGFGSSQLVETARYQRALEGEIARSIVTLDPVKAARVHLAFPKETVFVRERKKPSASVVVHLHAGRSLGKEQAQAIVHLVSASVPQLDPEGVTVIDQEGRLLNSRDTGGELALSNKQFEHKREVEEYLIGRVENILSPLVGREGLRTQVSADIDFTVTERTQELYNPDQPALRSEQTAEQQNRGAAGAQGIPGALSNQPPAAGTAPEVAAGQASGAAQAGGGAESLNRNATRNFELDRTVSHSRLAVGGLRRFTAAVVVDNRRVRQEDGGISEKPYSEEELVRFGDLVKEALGFDVTRGDRVMVTNAAFKLEEALPETPLWEQDWFWAAVRQGTALLAILAVVLGVIRPLLRLAIKGPPRPGEGEAAGLLAGPGGLEEDRLTLSQAGEEGPLLLESPAAAYQRHLDFARKTIESDPKRVAQLIRIWMTANG